MISAIKPISRIGMRNRHWFRSLFPEAAYSSSLSAESAMPYQPGQRAISVNLNELAGSGFEYRMSNMEFRTGEVKNPSKFNIPCPIFDVFQY